MLDHEFFSQVKRLESAFGAKAFDAERCSMIRGNLRHLTGDQFERIVNQFINSKRPTDPPLPKEFSEAAASQNKSSTQRKYFLGDIQPREMANCFDCADSGFVRLKRVDGHEAWAKFETGSAPCHCERGAMVSRNVKYNLGPQFNDNWKRSYEILSEYGKNK